MKKGDVNGVLENWLHNSKRKLTNQQHENLETAHSSCPLPLFLKLCYDEALRWHSYDQPDANQLQKTVIETIEALFLRLEKAHGTIMVSQALGCLTACKLFNVSQALGCLTACK